MRSLHENLTPVRPRVAAARSAFTLIEMLVVIGIIGILATLSIGALMYLPERARTRATQSLITKIDVKLMQIVAEFNRGKANLASGPMDVYLSPVSGSGVPNPQRAKVIALKHNFRQSFPEVFSDLDLRLGLAADGDSDGYLRDIEFQNAVYWNNTSCPKPPLYRNSQAPQNCMTPPLPAAIPLTRDGRAYWLQIAEKLAKCPQPGHQRGSTERAELLYLIVTRGGTDTADFFAGEIGDTDNDGLDEFVDKWGNPIQFFLWPSYYASARQNPGEETDPDDVNQLLVQSDWWNPSAGTDPRPLFEQLFHSLSHLNSSSGRPAAKGYRMHPLIISAGPDGGFGLQGVRASAIGWTTDPAGPDGIWGTQDDLLPIGLMASPSADGKAGTNDDGTPLISAAMRIGNPAILGYGQDQDNIDNHSLRAQ